MVSSGTKEAQTELGSFNHTVIVFIFFMVYKTDFKRGENYHLELRATLFDWWFMKPQQWLLLPLLHVFVLDFNSEQLKLMKLLKRPHAHEKLNVWFLWQICLGYWICKCSTALSVCVCVEHQRGDTNAISSVMFFLILTCKSQFSNLPPGKAFWRWTWNDDWWWEGFCFSNQTWLKGVNSFQLNRNSMRVEDLY